MPSLFLFHTALLIMSSAGVYLWLSIPALASSTLQLVAILVLLYFGTHWLRTRRPQLFHRSSVTSDITILTSMILLLVTETGALASPFFFLCYFLLFGVAMLYEIEATLILTGVFILFFLFLPNSSLGGPDGLTHIAQIISLVMITPLAIFMGHQYEASLEEKQLRDMLTKRLGAEQTDTLLFLSLNLKKTLIKALDSLSIIIPTTKVKTARTNLETLYSDLKALYRTSNDLENALDQDSKD